MEQLRSALQAAQSADLSAQATVDKLKADLERAEGSVTRLSVDLRSVQQTVERRQSADTGREAELQAIISELRQALDARQVEEARALAELEGRTRALSDQVADLEGRLKDEIMTRLLLRQARAVRARLEIDGSPQEHTVACLHARRPFPRSLPASLALNSRHHCFPPLQRLDAAEAEVADLRPRAKERSAERDRVDVLVKSQATRISELTATITKLSQELSDAQAQAVSARASLAAAEGSRSGASEKEIEQLRKKLAERDDAAAEAQKRAAEAAIEAGQLRAEAFVLREALQRRTVCARPRVPSWASIPLSPPPLHVLPLSTCLYTSSSIGRLALLSSTHPAPAGDGGSRAGAPLCQHGA